jgi:chloride channel protein, CIC family
VTWGPLRTARLAPRIAGRGWLRLVERFNRLGISEQGILFAFAATIGALGALGVVGFYAAIDLAYEWLYRFPGEALSRIDFLAYRPLLTAFGLWVAWWIMKRLGRDHDGMNVPDVQLAVARRHGRLPARPAIARTAASAVTLGAGGSAGSEGPVVVLGAAIGSFVGRAFRFDPSRVTVLVGAGAAAGISAAFNAPLAGAFFALEEILGSFAVVSFSPVVVASVIASVVVRAFYGNHPAFPIPMEYGFALQRELLLFYPLLGVVVGLVGVLFVRTYFGMGALVRRAPLPAWLVPWVGGLLVGALVFLSHGRLVGFGHLAVRLEVFGRMTWTALALLALGKIVATSVTLNAGGSGGVFGPSLFLGAATGGAFGVGLADLFPGLGLHPEAYALVGMGAMIAAATSAPLTAILIVFEMTNDYAIVLPLMLTTVIAYLVARHFERDSLYSGWLRRRGQAIEHGAERDVLAELSVADAYNRDPAVIGEGATAAQLVEHLSAGEQLEFPVVGENLTYVGMIGLADIGRVAKEYGEVAHVVVAADLARDDLPTVSPEETLLDAVRRMGSRGSSSLPVVDAATGRLLGLLSRANVLAAYERAVASGGERGQRVERTAEVGG